MSTTLFSKLGHVEVCSPSRTGRLFESLLQRKGIKRRVALRTPHHLSLPAIVESTDLVATVPLAVAVWFARHGVKLVPLPFNPGTFEVNQHWQRRYHQDARHRWLRQQVSTLFNDTTDSWRETAEKLYAKRGGQLRVADDRRCASCKFSSAIRIEPVSDDASIRLVSTPKRRRRLRTAGPATAGPLHLWCAKRIRGCAATL